MDCARCIGQASLNSGGGALDPRGRDQRREPLAGVEHARLHGALRDGEKLGDVAIDFSW